MRRDLLVRDPTRAIERAAEADPLRSQFGLEELTRLMAWPSPDPVARRRLALCLYAGLRADEAAALTWADVDQVGGVLLIRIHAGHRLKRGRERIVPIQPELTPMLGDPGQQSAAVAPGHPGNFRRAWPAVLGRCGVGVNGRSLHSLRHAYAGLMTACGVPGPLLSAYLGHTSAATTMIYTRLAARYVGAVAAWPRGRLCVVAGR
jgi:integrase